MLVSFSDLVVHLCVQGKTVSPRGGDALSLAVPGLKDGAVYGAAGMWCFTFAVIQSRWRRRIGRAYDADSKLQEMQGYSMIH